MGFGKVNSGVLCDQIHRWVEVGVAEHPGGRPWLGREVMEGSLRLWGQGWGGSMHHCPHGSALPCRLTRSASAEAEELYQKRVLTITGICVALLVVGIVCVVAYCKTK